jgi:ATP-dependent helicase HepA
LICDRSAEEGRNLQTADLAIHFDLPISPNRLEQRIGRFDRFSERRNHQTQSKIFVEHESEFLSAYLKLMEDGVGVFMGSVATLQLPLADLESQVTTNLLVEGVNALRLDLNQLKESLDEERQKIALLEQLEATAIDSDFSLGDFAAFEEFDENWGDTAEAFDLLTSRDNGIGLVTHPKKTSKEFKGLFEYRTRGGVQAPALIPHEHFLEMAADMPGRRSFNRVLARGHKGVKVMGLGDPFVDRIENYLRIDERGRARVAYRHFSELDEPQLWLCFDYLIEFEDHNLPMGKRRRLRRRGDVFFPPMQQTVWTNGQSVPTEDLICKLEGDDKERDWRNQPEYPVRGAHWRTVIELFPNWEEQVLRCADHARELLAEEFAEESVVGERLAGALDRARGDAKRRLQILRLQIERTDDVVVEEVLEATREREMEILEAVEHGLEEPRVQMIAAGAYVLANEEISGRYDTYE